MSVTKRVRGLRWRLDVSARQVGLRQQLGLRHQILPQRKGLASLLVTTALSGGGALIAPFASSSLIAGHLITIAHAQSPSTQQTNTSVSSTIGAASVPSYIPVPGITPTAMVATARTSNAQIVPTSVVSSATTSGATTSGAIGSRLLSTSTSATPWLANFHAQMAGSAAATSASYLVAPITTTQDGQSQDLETVLEQSEETVLFEADSIYRDTIDSPIIAEGNVRAFFGERYMTAERLSFDPATNVVIADGQVSVTEATGETVFAERFEITGDLRDAIAENFTALLAENARVAADSAIRRQGARTDLRKVVYTACDVCKENGDEKTPTWRIKSLRVTRDEERRVILFRHAFLEIKGVPILYTPFLQTPDPTVERQSGFLTPLIGTSSRLSGFIEIPYYFAISNHLDFTFSPKFTLSDGTLWQGEFRRSGRNSFHVWAGGVIDFDQPARDAFGNFQNENGDFADAGNNIRDENNQIIVRRADNPAEPPEIAPGVRWYYFGRGFHNVTNNFRIGYDIERTSDDIFARRYDVRRTGDLRLEFDRSLTNRLRSNINAAWKIGSSTLTADTYLFQGLRASDDSSVTPYVLPLLNFHHDFNRKLGGGNVSINANFASLQRTSGTDSRRITTQALWTRDYITRGGHRFNAFAELRGDAFFFQDLDEGTENILSALVERGQNTTSIVGRFAPTVGVEWSYPLGKYIGGTRFLIEPRVQVVASPSNRNNAEIINEDSQVTEFDFSSLFNFNKATGFDAFEDGQRANVGLSGSVTLPSGVKFEAAVGQQFRVQDTNAFSFGTGRGDLFTPTVGLGGTRSDFVGEANIEFARTFSFNNRLRFNTGGQLRQVDSSLGFDLWRINGLITYARLEDVIIDTSARSLGGLTIDTITDLDEINAVTDVEEVNALARFQITDHWSLGAAWRENLRPAFNEDTGLFDDGTIRQDFLLGYRDECSSFDIIFRRNLTNDRSLGADTSVLVRFSLTSLTQANFAQRN